MLARFKFRNWRKNYPSNLLEYLFSPCPKGLRIVNLVSQKVFGLNRKTKFMVHFSSIVSGEVEIGKGVARFFANCNGCYVQGINGVFIDDGTIFAPGVKIISANHDKNKIEEHENNRPIRIGKNCWLGTNSVILPGVELGDNTIVGAGSVVTKPFPSNVVLAGVPARIINRLE